MGARYANDSEAVERGLVLIARRIFISENNTYSSLFIGPCSIHSIQGGNAKQLFSVFFVISSQNYAQEVFFNE